MEVDIHHHHMCGKHTHTLNISDDTLNLFVRCVYVRIALLFALNGNGKRTHTQVDNGNARRFHPVHVQSYFYFIIYLGTECKIKHICS